MEDVHFFNTFVIWTRSVVLILSIVVVILSLSIYNYSAMPVFSLLEQNVTNAHQTIYAIIQDRRLIATLVAAQASIFCPLFLLMSSCNTSSSCHEYVTRRSSFVLSTSEIWRAIVEQFCQFLMPLGLAMSWIFCIMFDRRTEAALIDQNRMVLDFAEDLSCALAVYVANGLKYIIIIVLVVEVLAIWLSSYTYALVLFKTQYQQKSIRLDEEETDVGFAVLCGQEQVEQEKVLLI